MQISLKVDVEDSSGFREGLPAILSLLEQYQVKATFFFSTGYDNTGLRIRNLFQPLVLTRQLPILQKTYGLLLPPVSLSKKFRTLMHDCAAAGHDIGLKGFDSVTWQSQAINARKDWIHSQFQWAMENFETVFGKKPSFSSVPANVVNVFQLKLMDEYGFDAAFDTLGKVPYYPDYQGYQGNTLQIPVTLPSIEALLLQPDITIDNVHEYLYVESQKPLSYGHVYEVRAAYEGRQWLPVLEKMIVMWRSSQWEFMTASELLEKISGQALNRHQVGWGQYKPDNHYKATQSLPIDS
ncbi:MAG: polysaccharide deacetylase family protein [Gammaproteobacteria bacterium]|nr:polysaccharide deacetylase family protein [Gammaproteobacteria bacterium]